MRSRAILSVLLSVGSSCHVATSRTAPVALCEAAAVDSTWREASIGNRLAIMIPSSMTDARRTTAIPAGQQWWDDDLALFWITLGPGPWDSILPGEPGQAPSQCAAPAPQGWATYTFITIDRPALSADVYMVPTARQDTALTLHILARESKFSQAVAIAKSLHQVR